MARGLDSKTHTGSWDLETHNTERRSQRADRLAQCRASLSSTVMGGQQPGAALAPRGTERVEQRVGEQEE